MAQLEIIKAIREKYPTPLGATHAQFLLECAAATKMGLLRKTGGTRIALPPPHLQNGFPIEVSQDILMDPASGRIFDMLEDGEGPRTRQPKTVDVYPAARACWVVLDEATRDARRVCHERGESGREAVCSTWRAGRACCAARPSRVSGRPGR